MLSKIKNLREEREQGFTLIELLVVILIIGILSAIAIPAFMNQRKVAIDATVESDVRNTLTPVTDWTVKNHGKPVPRETHIGKGGATTAFINAPLGVLVSASAPSTNVLDMKVSLGNGITIAPNRDIDQVGQYCAYGFNASGDRSAKTPGIIFDSAKGGMTETGWCAENVPAEVEDWIPGTGTNPDEDLEVPATNEMIITDDTNGDKIIVTWRFVKAYVMGYDIEEDKIAFTFHRESDGQPVNGTMHHWQNGTADGSRPLVENGISTGQTSWNTATGIPVPVTSISFASSELPNSSIHTGSATNTYSFDARPSYRAPTAPSSVQGTLQLFGAPKAWSVPTSLGGTINAEFPEKAEGRRAITITAYGSSKSQEIWNARGYSTTSKSGSTEFHTKDIRKDSYAGNDVKKIVVSVALDHNHYYEYEIER